MYLSKLTLNPRSRQVRRDLGNPYEMHRTLSWAVSEALAEGKERLLWRLEPGRPETPILLVQTWTFPRWDLLLDRHPGYADVDPESPKPYEPTLEPNQVFRFRIRANASVKRLGKRHALRTVDEKLAWLEQRFDASGLGLDAADVVAEERLRARKPGCLITVDATLFEGRLHVANPESARAALVNGIGHAKGLGLGLLSIARERSG